MNYLMKLRRIKGLSLEQVGKVVGVTKQAVMNWEHGKCHPKADNAVALANLYGVTVYDISMPSTSEFLGLIEGLAAPVKTLLMMNGVINVITSSPLEKTVRVIVDDTLARRRCLNPDYSRQVDSFGRTLYGKKINSWLSIEWYSCPEGGARND